MIALIPQPDIIFRHSSPDALGSADNKFSANEAPIATKRTYLVARLQLDGYSSIGWVYRLAGMGLEMCIIISRDTHQCARTL